MERAITETERLHEQEGFLFFKENPALGSSKFWP